MCAVCECYHTLVAEGVDSVVYDAVRVKALSLGQQAQQGGDLEPH